MIPVTKPFFPPRAELNKQLDSIYESGWLTNNGPLLRSLEDRLEETLSVPWLRVVSNGTIAIQLAIQSLGLKGRVVTTPFSYVATLNALLWERCEPVFVDIDPDTLCIDAEQVGQVAEEAEGVLATHVFGIPCDVHALQRIGEAAQLSIIYDAAHAFGVRFDGKSLLRYGDLSTLSFHATKLFHMVEGGAVIGHTPKQQQSLERLRNFGQQGRDQFLSLGINGKNSELHAAVGHCVLDHIQPLIADRLRCVDRYRTALQGVVKMPVIPARTEWNGAYAPVLFPTEHALLVALKRMEARDIHPRRYFYPSLNTLPFVQSKSLPVAEDVAHRVLCLPLYWGLSETEQETVCEAVVG